MDRLKERHDELIPLIEALDSLIRSKEWQVARITFEARVENLKRQLLTEASKPLLEDNKIYYVQGQLDEARRMDLPSYIEKLRKELQGIKLKLQ